MTVMTEGMMSPTKAGITDDWETPDALYQSLDREFSFDVDVCAHQGNHKHERYWSIEDDGLSQDWAGMRCYMNPPYGREIGAWVRKAADSAQGGGGGLLWSDCFRAERTPHGGVM